MVGSVLLVALWASPAFAQYTPNQVSPTSVLGTGVVNVAGSGCAAFQKITITVYPESAAALAGNPTVPPVISASTTADENGNYAVQLHIPAGLAPGWYDILGPCKPKPTTTKASQASSKLYFLGRFLIVAPGSTSPGTGTGTGTGPLARTGSNLSDLGLVGAGLLVAGGLFLVATKRRRHPLSRSQLTA